MSDLPNYKPIPEDILLEIAEKCGTSLDTVGNKLGVPLAKMEEFKESKPLDYSANEMLKMWWRKAPPTKAILMEALKDAGRTDVARYVEENMAQNVKASELPDVAKQLGAAWQKVGTHLGVDHNKKESITSEKKIPTTDAAESMLKYWQRKLEADKNQKQILIDALIAAERMDIAEWVEHHVSDNIDRQ